MLIKSIYHFNYGRFVRLDVIVIVGKRLHLTLWWQRKRRGGVVLVQLQFERERLDYAHVDGDANFTHSERPRALAGVPFAWRLSSC